VGGTDLEDAQGEPFLAAMPVALAHIGLTCRCNRREAKERLGEIGRGQLPHRLPRRRSPTTTCQRSAHPRKFRRQLRDGSLQLRKYLQAYQRHLKKQEAAIATLEKLISEAHCCLPKADR
jgi:hypothetical protein